MAVTLFGFQLIKAEPDPLVQKTFTLPSDDDGAVNIQSGAYYGTYVDLDGIVRNEIELIGRYREMSMQPELENAIDQIVNETIVSDDAGNTVEINCDEVEQPEPVLEAIRAEFKYILKLLNFGNNGHEIFRRWYVDGRLFYHLVINDAQPKLGIQEVRYIDPRRIRKIREIQKTKDTATGMDIIGNQIEYYLYNERGMIGAYSNLGTKIAVDSIVNVNSGLMDSKRAMVLSYLHKAIKPLNQLRMMEDATVIYRLSRAPERRVFYIDIGTMPTIKAEQYVKDIATKYRNKLVYDANTGEIKDDRRHLSMLEDFWFPRREGSKGTEVTTLKGGENLGKMEDVDYFNQKMYKALGIPISRLEAGTGFSLGRTTEVTRDELNFTKFIQRLRNKFSTLFDDLMRVQLVLKNICLAEEWDQFRENIWYDFKKDNNFNELKEAELLMNRLGILQMVAPFVGTYYSMDWVKKNILHLSEDEIIEMANQINMELASGMMNMGLMGMAPGLGVQPGQPMPAGALPPAPPPPEKGPPSKKNDSKDDDKKKKKPPAKKKE
jgi:hypothetical protein